ncbi:hypothetical protein EYF80_017119 [Liparis tanakae]|uniref:Uncharacterized protein n=1 Tax=Liparis tanakae TaxID=230148 RepID=A0A4Z2I4C8_9TELE|nr:hypothetical protein EYF80_017119 [Liparis tanakae]
MHLTVVQAIIAQGAYGPKCSAVGCHTSGKRDHNPVQPPQFGSSSHQPTIQCDQALSNWFTQGHHRDDQGLVSSRSLGFTGPCPHLRTNLWPDILASDERLLGKTQTSRDVRAEQKRNLSRHSWLTAGTRSNPDT